MARRNYLARLLAQVKEPDNVRQCPHGYHHPSGPHSCDGCWCEGERDRRQYGWPHNTDPREEDR
jgi:hypothetical protein